MSVAVSACWAQEDNQGGYVTDDARVARKQPRRTDAATIEHHGYVDQPPHGGGLARHVSQKS
jgi:hypothetical protein